MEIVLANLSKSYGAHSVLNHINYTFRGPGLYIVFGHSGCGKTTLLNLLAGIEKVSTGTLDYRENNDNCGFVFQHHYLLGDLSCRENIVLPLAIRKEKVDNKTIEAEAEYFQVASILQRKIKHCSGGEAQRVNIMRTLVLNPDFILADEPTGSVDFVSAQLIKKRLVELSYKKLIIIVTHDRKLFSNLTATYLTLTDGTLLDDEMEN